MRIPGWCSVAALVVLLGVLGAMQWRQSARRAALWREDGRESPSRLAMYLHFDASTVQSFQRACELIVEHRPLSTPGGALARNELGCIYAVQSKNEEAAELLRQALEAHREMLGDEHEDARTIQRNLAAVEADARRASEPHPAPRGSPSPDP